MATAQRARTQDLIPIKSIKNGIVQLKDGSLRKVILVDGTNFDLKSEQEQQLIVGAYQSMLNALDFSLQTQIHSRKLNVDGYLENLTKRLQVEDNPLIHTQIEEYIEFIKSFVGENAIMAKSFFVIVPYDPSALPTSAAEATSFLGNLFGKRKQAGPTVPVEEIINPVYIEQLTQRVDQILGALNRIGLRAIPLEDPELVELYFNAYNPMTVEGRGKEIGRKAEKGTDAVGELVAPPSLEVKPGYLKVGEKLAKTLFVSNYPRFLATGWLSPVINLPETIDISIYVHP